MDVLKKENVQLNRSFSTKEEAIREAGRILVEGGYVDEAYIHSMLKREEIATTFMGNDIAIPHGTDEAKELIKASGLSVIQVPEGVSFSKGEAKVIIGIAGAGDEHLEILSEIAIFCSEVENVQKLAQAQSEQEIVELLGGGIDA